MATPVTQSQRRRHAPPAWLLSWNDRGHPAGAGRRLRVGRSEIQISLPNDETLAVPAEERLGADGYFLGYGQRRLIDEMRVTR
jgi:hypothetical protein